MLHTESESDRKEQDALSMFFQENFSPENYVNALHASILGPSQNRYSPEKLAEINSKSQDIITHLEYNSNEILRELADKTGQIQRISASMAHHDSETSDHTRLQYYVDAFSNSVDTLQADMAQVREALPDRENDHVKPLIQLKTIKANILSVHECLQKTRVMVGGDVVSEKKFSEALSSLSESLHSKARQSEDSKKDVAATVAELKSWAPMFHPFSRFGPIYSKFLLRLDDLYQ